MDVEMACAGMIGIRMTTRSSTATCSNVEGAIGFPALVQ